MCPKTTYVFDRQVLLAVLCTLLLEQQTEPLLPKDSRFSVLCHRSVGTLQPGKQPLHQLATYRQQRHLVPEQQLPQEHSMLLLDHTLELLEQQELRSSQPQHPKLQTTHINTQTFPSTNCKCSPRKPRNLHVAGKHKSTTFYHSTVDNMVTYSETPNNSDKITHCIWVGFITVD